MGHVSNGCEWIMMQHRLIDWVLSLWHVFLINLVLDLAIAMSMASVSMAMSPFLFFNIALFSFKLLIEFIMLRGGRRWNNFLLL